MEENMKNNKVRNIVIVMIGLVLVFATSFAGGYLGQTYASGDVEVFLLHSLMSITNHSFCSSPAPSSPIPCL